MAVVVILFARSRLQILALSTLTIILSLVLEAAQGYVPHRYADVADALANMTGAVAGGVLALLIFRHLSVSASYAARA
jgi:VanZ family protein